MAWQSPIPEVAGAIGTAILAWLGRRKAATLWRTIQEIRRANERLENCRIERDDAIRARDYLRVALAELTDAAAKVRAAKEAGLLTTSETSSTAPAISPATSAASPARPRRPRGRVRS